MKATVSRGTPMRTSLIYAAGVLAVLGLVPGEPAFVVEPAHAVVGRPMTPVSYAGVARRTTRRAVYATAAAPVGAPRQCYTSYDSYGRAVTTCY